MEENESESVEKEQEQNTSAKSKIMPGVTNENMEETKKKIRSKLEYLLSQNDILPLLKTINSKEEVKSDLFDFSKQGKNDVIILEFAYFV